MLFTEKQFSMTALMTLRCVYLTQETGEKTISSGICQYVYPRVRTVSRNCACLDILRGKCWAQDELFLPSTLVTTVNARSLIYS
jgi:hypothetical protein